MGLGGSSGLDSGSGLAPFRVCPQDDSGWAYRCLAFTKGTANIGSLRVRWQTDGVMEFSLTLEREAKGKVAWATY